MLAGCCKVLLWLLQVLTEQSEATERDQLRLNQELEQISAWGDQLTDLVAALEDLAGYFGKYFARRNSGPVGPAEQQLRHLSDHFHEVPRLQHACKHVLQHLCHRPNWFWTGYGVFGVYACFKASALGFDLLVLDLDMFCYSVKSFLSALILQFVLSEGQQHH